MTEAIGFLAANACLEQALEQVLDAVPEHSPRRFVLERSAGRRSRKLSRLLCVSWITDACDRLRSQVEEVSRRWDGYLVFVSQDTPAEALSAVARLRVQDPSRLQFVTADSMEQVREHLEAFVQRLNHGDDSERILHSWWSEGALEILTTRFRRLRVQQASIPPLAHAREEECRNFETAYDGSYLAWPKLDVHLGFEQLEEWVTPELANRRRQMSSEYNRRYGAAIRSVREARDLTQSSIQGLSARHLGRIESGAVRATSKALRVLARAHGLSEDEYLAAVAAALEKS